MNTNGVNVGTVDRWIRGVVGIALILYPVLGAINLWGFFVGAVGMVILSTAILSECPLYSLLGLSTFHGVGHIGAHGHGGHAQPHPQ